MSNFTLHWFKQHIGTYTGELSPSPYGRWLNGFLQEASEDSFVMIYTVREDMTNPVKILHGGVTAGMVDDVMGMMLAALSDEFFFTTVNLSVDYLSSAKVGEKVSVHSKIVRKGKQIINAECRVSNADGKLIAKASSNCVVTNIKLK